MTGDAFAGHYDDYYEQEGWFTDWRAAGAREKFENIAALWGNRPPSAIVDIGCGNGAIAAHMSEARFYSTLHGFDVSSSGVGQAKARNLPDATFEVTAGSIPTEDKAFDLAVLSHVVEHVDEPRQVLREAARVARHVIVEVPLEHTVRHGGDFQWTQTGHVNFYDLTLIRKLMQSCDLDVIGELVTTPGRVWASSQHDRKAYAKWAVKQIALRAAPPVARGVFTYHATLLAACQ